MCPATPTPKPKIARDQFGIDRKQPGIHLRLNLGEPGKLFDVLMAGVHQRVADRSAFDILDAGHDIAYFSGTQYIPRMTFRCEVADFVNAVHFATRLDDNSFAFPDLSLNDTDERNNTQVVVEPGIDDKRLQRRLYVTARCRDALDDLF